MNFLSLDSQLVYFSIMLGEELSDEDLKNFIDSIKDGSQVIELIKLFEIKGFKSQNDLEYFKNILERSYDYTRRAFSKEEMAIINEYIEKDNTSIDDILEFIKTYDVIIKKPEELPEDIWYLYYSLKFDILQKNLVLLNFLYSFMKQMKNINQFIIYILFQQKVKFCIVFRQKMMKYITIVKMYFKIFGVVYLNLKGNMNFIGQKCTNN